MTAKGWNGGTRILTDKYIDIPKGSVINVIGVVSYDRWCCKLYTKDSECEFYARIDDIMAVSKEIVGGV